ncbi:MAG: methylated-DNA--[protein]-cysteine S-methyltransferase [Candidatus Omnitrophica bacterium]|nr:methylated-DNA--[protein]-cysteine S-methyltransferase [Candidatus Omnitrophota bacterium]
MTPFEKKVLKVVSGIPVGEVRTYKWVAEKAGRPSAWRAVANVMKKNPYPLIIPCHRVVPSSGGAGGYTHGARLKKDLLALESKIKNMIE